MDINLHQGSAVQERPCGGRGAICHRRTGSRARKHTGPDTWQGHPQWVEPSVDPSHEPKARPDHFCLERPGLGAQPDPGSSLGLGPACSEPSPPISCSIGLHSGPRSWRWDRTAARPAPSPASPGTTTT